MKYARLSMDSGETVKALAVKIEGTGSGTMISLRPERVVVNPDADKYPNRLSAKVARTYISGRSYTLPYERLRT